MTFLLPKSILLVTLFLSTHPMGIVLSNCRDLNNLGTNLKVYSQGERHLEVELEDNRWAAVDQTDGSGALYWFKLAQKYEMWFQTIPTPTTKTRYFKVKKQKAEHFINMYFTVPNDMIPKGQSVLSLKEIADAIADVCFEVVDVSIGKKEHMIEFCCDFEESGRRVLSEARSNRVLMV